QLFLAIYCSLFLLNVTPTSGISPLSLHDALPISARRSCPWSATRTGVRSIASRAWSCTSSGGSGLLGSRKSTSRTRSASSAARRSEEHTSELQSREKLVCRLLLEKKKMKI